MTHSVLGRRQRRGSALVEFSISALLLMMVILATVEIDRMFLVYTAIANSTRAGCRYAIVHGSRRFGSGVSGPSGPGNTTQIESVIKNFASAGLLNVNQLVITITYSPNNDPGSTVAVKVTYPYDPFVGWFPQLAANLGSTTRGVITY